MDELERWLQEDYARAYRTACLMMRNPADAEDAVQEAFLRAWRFRASLPDGPAARPWLYRVLVNACHSRLRAEIPRRDRTAPATGVDRRPADGPGPAEAVEADHRASAVRGALDDLPDHLRAVVVLRYWSGLSEAEIATAIRRRPGTVKSRLHEARRRLAAHPALDAALAEEA